LRGVVQGARGFHGFADAFQVFDAPFLDRLRTRAACSGVPSRMV
jgi:hypothetical protein